VQLFVIVVVKIVDDAGLHVSYVQARTRGALEETLHPAIDWVTGYEAWFNNYGYHTPFMKPL
jgi:hypothetical protein